MARGGKIGIQLFGENGRMGRAIIMVAAERDDIEIVAEGGDVFVDFTAPEALEANLAAAIEAERPILVGTTGLGEAGARRIEAAAERVAVIQAPNTSLGVNLLRHLVEQAAARLGPDWDVEIFEMHHKQKRDAPSGTALLLGDAAAKGRGRALREIARFDRTQGGEREAGTIGFASLRGGSVAGEGERLELGHRADSRLTFARGAIAAALWLAGKAPGRYSMADVLGLK